MTARALHETRLVLLDAADGLRLFADAVGAEREAARWWRMRCAVEAASDHALAGSVDVLVRMVMEGVEQAPVRGAA